MDDPKIPEDLQELYDELTDPKVVVEYINLYDVVLPMIERIARLEAQLAALVAPQHDRLVKVLTDIAYHSTLRADDPMIAAARAVLEEAKRHEG